MELRARLRPQRLAALAAACAAATLAARADAPGPATLADVHARVTQAATAGLPAHARVVVGVGRLDPRLKLAPCARIDVQVPPRVLGSVRVGLRCADGARWHVHLPVTVQVFAPGWVAAAALPAGTRLGAEHLERGEVDLAAGALALDDVSAIGRTLARPLAAGDALRGADLRARQWFAAGDAVQLVAVGRGWRISGHGQALGAGIEGQRVRVRTESGRIVTGVPVAPSRVEVAL